jgi:hypothetical protein
VASSSNAVPIKKSGFLPEEEDFADAESYQDWKFVYTLSMGHRKIAATPGTGN